MAIRALLLRTRRAAEKGHDAVPAGAPVEVWPLGGGHPLPDEPPHDLDPIAPLGLAPVYRGRCETSHDERRAVAHGKLFQVLGQLIGLRYLGAIQQEWDHGNIALESGPDLDPHVIVRIIQPARPR